MDVYFYYMHASLTYASTHADIQTNTFTNNSCIFVAYNCICIKCVSVIVNLWELNIANKCKNKYRHTQSHTCKWKSIIIILCILKFMHKCTRVNVSNGCWMHLSLSRVIAYLCHYCSYCKYLYFCYNENVELNKN